MSPFATVLVGITSRNRADILPKAIASALAQQGVPVAVAVLDDGSTDHTPTLRAGFPGVRWDRNEQPQGIIESRNQLMIGTSAEFYVSLDDDAWFLEGDEIALAVQRMREEPRVGAIAFDILTPDKPDQAPRSGAERVAMFIGCGHLLRLEAVRAAGFYAASPGTYGSEEKDLSLRLIDHDFAIEKLRGVHVWHEKAWSGRDWFPLHRSGVCNELVMTVRRCPAPDVFLVLPMKLVSFGWYWIRRPRFLAAGLAGIGTFLRHLGLAWRTRQPVSRATFWAVTRGRLT